MRMSTTASAITLQTTFRYDRATVFVNHDYREYYSLYIPLRISVTLGCWPYEIQFSPRMQDVEGRRAVSKTLYG
jgi:hypothetical protein